jgi:hypothetical protein
MGKVSGLHMRFITDVDPTRICRPADKLKVLLTKSNQQNQGFKINRVEIRQYVERKDRRLGDYSLITAVVETDKGAVEMKYDEGFRGPDALDSVVVMLTEYIGLAALINRALIELQH